MRYLTLRTWILIAACAVLILSSRSLRGETVVDFEDLPLADGTAAPADADEEPFVSHGVSFNRNWDQQWNCCPGGWAYSNQKDLVTTGLANPYSAYSLPEGGGAHGSSNFAVAYDTTDVDSVITLPAPSRVEGMYVTNTTYVYRAVVDGDDGAGFVKGPFVDGDWLKLDVIGRDVAETETGRVEFYLADFREGKSVAVSDWTWVDLEPLGEQVKSLEFELSSTDTGQFGMNTPGYFAMDDLTITQVPEPPGIVLAVAAALLLVTSGRPGRHEP